MKCLTYDESQKWLALKNVRIDENRNLWFAREQERIMMTTPKRALAMHCFSEQLTDWIPSGSNCMFWLSNWSTDPPNQLALFELVRFACGEPRHIIDAPGHLFDLKAEQSTTGITGLLLL